MKKIICFVFILFFILSFKTTFALEDNAIKVDAVKVSDETLEVNILIDENGINGLSFNLNYDNTVLSYKEENNNISSNVNSVINSNYKDNCIRVVCVSATEIPKGNLMTLKFESVKNSKSNIELSDIKISDGLGEKRVLNNIIISVDFSKKGTLNPENSGNTDTSITTNPQFSNTENSSESTILKFNDVNKSDWFYEGVKYVYENNLMQGISEYEFAPDIHVTRAMFVTIIYRIEGQPFISGNIFSDVQSDSWYANAVAWACENNIVFGISNKEFKPNDEISREQMVTILYRYLKYKI